MHRYAVEGTWYLGFLDAVLRFVDLYSFIFYLAPFCLRTQNARMSEVQS